MKSTMEFIFGMLIAAMVVGFIVVFLMTRVNGDKDIYTATMDIGTEIEEVTEDNQTVSGELEDAKIKPTITYIGGTLKNYTDYDLRELFKITYKDEDYYYNETSDKWETEDGTVQTFFLKLKDVYNSDDYSVMLTDISGYTGEEGYVFYTDSSKTLNINGTGIFTFKVFFKKSGNYKKATISVPVEHNGLTDD